MRVAPLLLLLAARPPAMAATYVVDTTSDSGALGACTAATGVSQALIIDGYTQAAAQADTIPAPGANDARLKIELTAIPGFNSCRLFEGQGAPTLRGVAMFLPSGAMISGVRPRFVVQGNGFGVTAAGTAPDHASDGNVLSLSSCTASEVLIGGPNPADRNVIAGSGRDVDGLPGGGSALVCAATGTLRVQGNLIGLAPDGVTPLPLRDAFQIRSQKNVSPPAPVAQIDFTDNRLVRATRNFSGGLGGGLRSSASALMDVTARLQGNVFGLVVDGARIGVERDHLFLDAGSSANGHAVRIGGLGPGEGNVFAAGTAQPANAALLGSVVFVQDGLPLSRIELVGNRMLGNDGLGPDFPHPTAGGGVAIGRTPVDPDDPETGANNLQDFPEISAFALNGGQVELGCRVDSATGASVYPLRVDFYRALGDEGEVLVGRDTYAAAVAQSVRNVSFTPTGPVTADDVIVAIATDAEGRSSEFSFQPLQLTIEPPIPSSCSGNVHIYCDGFDTTGLPSLEVRVRATSSTFKPNGVVRVTSNRSAASCQITLRPTQTPLTSAGSCILVGAGAPPGPITITVTHDTLSGAFGSPTGQNIAVSLSRWSTDGGRPVSPPPAIPGRSRVGGSRLRVCQLPRCGSKILVRCQTWRPRWAMRPRQAQAAGPEDPTPVSIGRRLLEWMERFVRSLSPTGVSLATPFFAVSLAPSLAPRPHVLQGLLSGFALAAGYGLGVAGRSLWRYPSCRSCAGARGG